MKVNALSPCNLSVASAKIFCKTILLLRKVFVVYSLLLVLSSSIPENVFCIGNILIFCILFHNSFCCFFLFIVCLLFIVIVTCFFFLYTNLPNRKKCKKILSFFKENVDKKIKQTIFFLVKMYWSYRSA